MTKLEQFFEGQTDVLVAESKRAATIKHSASIGPNREAFLREFIKKSFPSKFVIGSGEVFDSKEHVTKQCDIVIYDELFPVLDHSSTQQFLAEGVLSHIEVKSNLTSAELKKALDITKSVKKIDREIDAIFETGEVSKKIFSCVFAYKGISIKTAKEVLDSYYKNETDINNKIDAVCVLGEYIIVKQTPDDSPKELHGIKTGNKTLGIFFVELYDSMFKNWMAQPDLLKYIK